MLTEDWRSDAGSKAVPRTSRANDFPANVPCGFSTTAQTAHYNVETENAADQQEHLKRKRAWDLAISPLKNIPMNIFMMYMTGRSISIFPIMMVGMMLWRPLKAIFSMNSTFHYFEETGSLILHKIVYVFGNCAVICLAIYRVHTMGLLPSYDSDWLEFIPEAIRQQYSLIGDIFV